jgi:HD-GYP domain-containing protein (c-di-GMP phosphodiesterase class II)
VVRRFAPSVRGLPTLASVIAGHAGRPARPGAFGPNGALIDFRGPPGTIPTVSFSELLAGNVDPSLLRDRIVIIGATAPTLHDMHATPLGSRLMSGPEIQANAIWTALHGLPLSPAPGWLNALVLLLAAFSVPVIALRVRAVIAALVAPALGFGYIAVAAVAFDHGVVLAQGGPIAALALASVATVAVSHLLETLERQRIASLNGVLKGEVKATELEIIQRLGHAVESRDEETGDHIRRIGELAHQLALAVGESPEEAELLRRASAMHDVGKIAIPDSILRKPGPLTAAERSVMQSHTTVGGDLLAGSRSPLVQLGEVIARTHHERWDGTGYPAGLAGESIPLAGRICAICDVFDALISDRPYKVAWSVDAALEEIRRERGGHFDPQLVDRFLGLGDVLAAQSPGDARDMTAVGAD